MGDPQAQPSAEWLPLFPLGTVLFPGLVLPLHVFEPRYRTLVEHLLELPEGPTRRFGVVAVRRGSEVGAGAAQEIATTGCIAEVRALVPRGDGRYDLVTVGRRRFTVHGIDETAATPYVTARVELLGEPAGAGADRLVPAVAGRFRDYLRLVTADQTAGEALPGEPVALSYLVAGQTVLDLPERLQLLEAVDAAARLRLELGLLRRELALVGTLGAVPATDAFGRRG